MILEVSAALELDKPVVMGCSIGGRIVLHLAHEHPEKFRAIIGLESVAQGRSLLRRRAGCTAPTCTAAKSRAGIVSGLVAPTAPDEGRWETLWHYMQSGPGVFKGDLLFLHDRRRHPRQARPDRRAPLPALSAHRRIRLLLHHRGHARSREAHRRAGDHHEGPRPFPDEREPARSSSAICCRCWKRSVRARRRAPHEDHMGEATHCGESAAARS